MPKIDFDDLETTDKQETMEKMLRSAAVRDPANAGKRGLWLSFQRGDISDPKYAQAAKLAEDAIKHNGGSVEYGTLSDDGKKSAQRAGVLRKLNWSKQALSDGTLPADAPSPQFWRETFEAINGNRASEEQTRAAIGCLDGASDDVSYDGPIFSDSALEYESDDHGRAPGINPDVAAPKDDRTKF